MFVDAYGFVHLQGTVQRVGSAPWTIFVLPPADRPHGALFFLAMDLNGTTTRPVSIHIADNGEVIDMGDAQPGDLISLSGITFHP